MARSRRFLVDIAVGWLFIAAAVLIACTAPAADLAARALRFDGAWRSYLVALPSAPAGKPIIYALHGGGSDPAAMAYASRLHERTDEFVVVYPAGVDGWWNARLVPEATADDVGFLRAVRDDLAARYGASSGRGFCTGFSAGAAMCYRLACDAPDMVRAIAPVAGELTAAGLSACSWPVNVATYHQHGTSDPIVPVAGGSSPAADAVTLSPLTEFWEAWTARAGAEYRLAIHANLGHHWPGSSPPRLLRAAFGPARPDIDGTGGILAFFMETL